MSAIENTIVTTDITVQAREIDFVTRFGRNWQALQDILGIMYPIQKTPGTQLVSYNAAVTLENGAVGEGEVIPFSHGTVTPVSYADVDIRKYAKNVTIEDVSKYGATIAVQRTDEAFLNELQGKVLDDFYAFLATGTLTATVNSFKMGVAKAIGKVQAKFQTMRRTATEVVVFVNTQDAYDYLGAAELTVQNVFGIQYVENFMGASRIILTSEIARGKVIATPVENIDLYYIDPSDSEFAQLGLEYTVQGETNLIGFHVEGDYSRATGATYALMGMKLWAEYLDGIAVITVDDGTTPSVVVTPSTATIAKDATKKLNVVTVPDDATVTWTTSDSTKATVSNGTVTGVAAGSATITATITVNSVSYSDVCNVTVTAGA